MPLPSRGWLPRPRRALLAAVLAVPLLASLVEDADASPEVYVRPRRAGQTNVRWFDFDWQTYDFDPTPADAVVPEKGKVKKLTGESGKSGGIRLYYYEREKGIAERAAASISDSWTYLGHEFGEYPEQRFPFVLYSSYQEFLRTNLFPLAEGILGVTSPQNLTLTLPWFGDDRLFRDVSTHELAHQFMIQKIRRLSRSKDVASDPESEMPNWFVEGLAEYYAQHGLDPEARMVARDLAVNPDVERGIGLHDFFADAPWDIQWTYKVGQVRCAFLEDTYGKGTIQKILDRTPELAAHMFTKSLDFQALLESVTGDDRSKISAKFESWLKQLAYAEWLASAQDMDDVDAMKNPPAYVDAMDSTPDGTLLALRAYEPERGEARIVLVDPKNPDMWRTVVRDNRPGAESLHPVSDRTFDLTQDAIVYVAESRGHDVIYWQAFDHKARETETIPEPEPPPDLNQPIGAAPPKPPSLSHGDEDEKVWSVKFHFGVRREFSLVEHDLVAAYSPTVSPDGKRVAFVGLDLEGRRDVYVLTPKKGDDYDLVKVTDDEASERQVAWGKDGLVFTSDRAGGGWYELYGVDPDHPDDVRMLTHEGRDHFSPTVLPDGRVLVTAWEDGRSDLFEVTDHGVVRRTDVTTGVFDPCAGPAGSVWTLFHRSGMRVPVKFQPDHLLDEEPAPETATTGAPATTSPSPETSAEAADSTSTPGSATPAAGTGATAVTTAASVSPATGAGGGLAPPTGSAPEATAPRLPLDGSKPYLGTNPHNWGLDGIYGYAGGGATGIYGQVLASASDVLKNHNLTLWAAMYGRPQYTDGSLVYVDQSKRFTWGGGPFQYLRYDWQQDQGVWFLSGQRFFGALGSVRYPLNRFVYLQGDLALGGAAFFLFPEWEDYLSDPDQNGVGDLAGPWLKDHEGTRFQTEATGRIGYDTTGYDVRTGPLTGGSVLLEGMIGSEPFEHELYGQERLDAAHYFPIVGATNITMRLGAGTSQGALAQSFFLSSPDTLRGVYYGDPRWLNGKHFLFGTTELQVPLDAVVRLAFVSNVEFVAAMDAGAIADDPDQLWDRRVLDGVLGTNLMLGPLVFRLHFARPIYTGVPLPTGDSSRWVTNVSLVWLYD